MEEEGEKEATRREKREWWGIDRAVGTIVTTS
jgi:hypothetical protein